MKYLDHVLSNSQQFILVVNIHERNVVSPFFQLEIKGPTLGAPLVQHRLVLAKDAVRTNGSVLQPLTRDIEECQRPENFDPAAVFGSIVICTFSDGFYNQMSTVLAITQTARTLGFMGFILIANPRFGDYVAEPVIFSAPGILIPTVSAAQVISLRKSHIIRK